MIQALDHGMRRILDRPIRTLVNPAALGVDSGFAIGIDHDFQAKLREAFREMGYKQFGSAVVGRRDGNERWRNEGDFQFTGPCSSFETGVTSTQRLKGIKNG